MNSSLLDSLAPRFGSLCFALVLATGALACDDGDDVGDDMSETMGDGDGDAAGDGDGDDGALSHAKDIQPIWDANCVTACHTPGGSAGALVDLSGDAYNAIVGVTSGQAPWSFIEPGNSGESYIMAKLRGTQAEVGGSGGSMPIGAMLPAETIGTIAMWIDAGAQP